MTSLSWAHISNKDAVQKRMVIFASKLAGCAGMHPYMNQDDMKYELLLAINGEDAVVPHGYLPPKAYEKQALETGMTKEANVLVQETMESLKEMDASASAKTVTSVVAKLNQMEGISEAAKDVVKTQLYTQHGIHGEDAIRQEVQHAMQKEIRVDNKFRTTKHPIIVLPGYDVYVGGRHDGMMEGSILTEIKNRTRRHLGAPLYERIQLHAYMDIFGVSRGLLIENYRKEAKQHDVYFEQDLWDGVVSSTRQFLEKCLLVENTAVDIKNGTLDGVNV